MDTRTFPGRRLCMGTGCSIEVSAKDAYCPVHLWVLAKWLSESAQVLSQAIAKAGALKPCPFCHALPVFAIRGLFIRGGCEEHLPDAVMQPVEMPEQVAIQWNTAIAPIEATLKLQGGNI